MFNTILEKNLGNSIILNDRMQVKDQLLSIIELFGKFVAFLVYSLRKTERKFERSSK